MMYKKITRLFMLNHDYSNISVTTIVECITIWNSTYMFIYDLVNYET